MGSGSKRFARVLTLLAAILVIASFAAQAAEVFIDVTRKRGVLVRIAAPDFIFKPSPAQKKKNKSTIGITAAKIMEFDLGFSGYFDVIKNRELMADIAEKERKTGKIDWQGWKDIGAHALIAGSYSIDKNGDIVTEIRLYDVERKEQIVGTRYTGPPSVFRKMAHRFADQVVYRFTGEAGIAETRIAYISKVGGHKEIFVSDYDGRNAKQVTKDASIVLSPDWSPKGTKLIFTTYRNKNPDVYIMDLKTGKGTPVSRGKALDSSATWSPDGKWVTFTKSSRGNSDIYRVKADGTGLERLTWTNSIETSPSYSPDGKRIVYISDFPGNPQLYIMDANGKNKKRFTYNGTYNADPAWSPDGESIAYATIADNKFNIIVKKIRTGDEKQLTLFSGTNEYPTWSPDGRHIAFTSSRSGRKEIYIMNRNGENQTRISLIPGGASSPAWSPR